jgi:hypothetical protein
MISIRSSKEHTPASKLSFVVKKHNKLQQPQPPAKFPKGIIIYTIFLDKFF